MNKKTYLSPVTICLQMDGSSLMQNTSQGPWADAKQNTPFDPAAMDDDNPWDRVGSGDNAKGLCDD